MEWNGEKIHLLANGVGVFNSRSGIVRKSGRVAVEW
jgi:hypothetical protein